MPGRGCRPSWPGRSSRRSGVATATGPPRPSPTTGASASACRWWPGSPTCTAATPGSTSAGAAGPPSTCSCPTSSATSAATPRSWTGSEDARAGPPAIVRCMANDPGLFGPESVSWRVQREATVMLVVAGARQTGMYANQPWRRLERTLRQTYTVVFGTREEALAASKRIDDVHRGIKGVDPVTGLPYDARDPELLLWVHACLVDSFLLFERLTVGKLDDAGRQTFHEESMVSAELLRLPRERIPPTVPALRSYLDEVIASGILRMTDGAHRVAELIANPPREVPQRPLWGLIGFLAFQTLPEPLRRLYGVRDDPVRRALLRASLLVVRAARPLAPPRIRFVAPAVMAGWRLEGRYGSLAEAATHWPRG